MAKAKTQQQRNDTASTTGEGDGAEILAIVEGLVRRPEIAAMHDEVHSIRAVASGKLSGFDVGHPIGTALADARRIAERLSQPIGEHTRRDIERLPILLERLGHRKCERCGEDFLWRRHLQTLCGDCVDPEIRKTDTLGKLLRYMDGQSRVYVDTGREPDRAMLAAICRDQFGDFDHKSVLRLHAKLVVSGKFASPSAVDELLIADVVKLLSAADITSDVPHANQAPPKTTNDTESDNETHSRKTWRPLDHHSRQCIAEYKKQQRGDAKITMKSVREQYAVDHPDCRPQGMKKRIECNPEEWKTSSKATKKRHR